jgi:predicted amidohydrolase
VKAALLQITSGNDPAANAGTIRAMMRQAAGAGAGFVLTPEVSNCISLDPAHQQAVLQTEAEDQTLASLRQTAAELGIWLSIGSLALKSGAADGRMANRSFLIGPDGEIVARYDKIHMFDVDVGPGETYRESAAFRPGDRAVLARTPFACIGMTVCYDIRFPHLYRALALAGAEVLLVPAAFSTVTGAAHWEPLLRARAIECGAYVLAAAQTGTNDSREGKVRRTWGHSLAISPWGEVLADAGTDVGIVYVDLDPAEVTKARGRIASLSHDRAFKGP